MHLSLAARTENAKFSHCQGVFSGASHVRRRVFITLYPHRSYGPDLPGLFKRAASYVDRILRGEKPAELPVQAPTRYELIINLKTAKALGLTVPLSLLGRADEVIE